MKLAHAGGAALVSSILAAAILVSLAALLPTVASPVGTPPAAAELPSAGSSGFQYQWSNLTGSSGPSSREGAMMVYDPVDGYVVLFGGVSPTTHADLDDTWTYHAGVWTNITATAGTAPPARSYGAIAWDAYDGYVLLYGGFSQSSGTWLSDTWSFVGGLWTQLSPSTSPGAYYGQVYGVEMTYDPAVSAVVFFGGESVQSTTWEFSGGQWSLISTAGTPPPAYYGSGMDYDDQARAVLQFGGWEGVNSFSKTTSTFANGTWTTVSSPHSPSARAYPALAYLPTIGAEVLFGGQRSTTGGAPASDTWLYTNGAWKEIHPSGTPPVDLGSSGAQNPMTYDARDGYLIVLTVNGSATWALSATNTQYQVVTNQYTAAYEGNVPSGEISKISAKWNVALVTCQPSLGERQFVDTYLTIQGSGGGSSINLEATCGKKSTVPAYSVVAILPGNIVRTLKLSVSPGNEISASITFNAVTGKTRVSMTDLTTAKIVNSSVLSSGFVPTFAGWVIGNGGGALAKFSQPINFSAASVVDSGSTIKISGLLELTDLIMVDSSGYVTAQPTALAGSGTSFGINWVAST
jgi:hypothetical protein